MVTSMSGSTSASRPFAKDATKVTSGLVDRLKYRHNLTDAEVFDIAALAAGRAFFAKLLDGLGVETDRTWKVLNADFRESLSIGRPMDLREPEQLPAKSAA